MVTTIQQHIPADRLDEKVNRERLAPWLERADVLQSWPVNNTAAFEILKVMQFDANVDRVARFAVQHPELAPEATGHQKWRWSAVAVAGFAAWLESRRLWLPGGIHQAKKVAAEVELEAGGEFGDLDLYDAEDLIRFVMTTDDAAERIALCLALELKLGIR